MTTHDMSKYAEEIEAITPEGWEFQRVGPLNEPSLGLGVNRHHSEVHEIADPLIGSV